MAMRYTVRSTPAKDPGMISKRAENLAPSATLAITQAAARLRAEGRSIIGLGAGQPDFDTPDEIKEAAIAALRNGETKYAPTAGIGPLREAAAAWVNDHHGLGHGAANVLVTAGAKMALALTFQALVDPGDEVVIVSPYWVSYPALVELCGGVSRIVEARFDEGFRLPVQRILDTVNERTRAVMLNSPCNPTGTVFAREDLVALARALTARGIYVISDEIYGHLIFEGSLGFADDPEVDASRVVIVDGFSKGWAMTGWRLGFVAATAPIISALDRLQGQSVTSATTFAQFGALRALELGDAVIAPMREEFRFRRDFVSEALEKLPGISLVRPEGTFYAFPKIDGVLGGSYRGRDLVGSADFCRALLEEQGVATVPGAPFGAEGHIRMSFSASRADLEEGLARLQRFVDEVEHGA